MKEIIIDGDKIDSKAEVQELFVKELGFNDCYGNNLDSLGDCLDDLKTPVTIRYINRERMKIKFGRYATVLSQVIRLAAKHNSKISYYESK
ncbi:MAG: barstar family protein [Candidatus Metalachnospira sp.]|nr:barstar family protein [Candidatus Metalachnospira sp.]